METNKFLLNLGLARRADKAVFGFDEVANHLFSGGYRGIFCSDSAAENTKRRLERVCEEYGATVVYVPFTANEIGIATGRKPTAIVAINGKGFYSLLMKSLNENGGNA